MILTVQALTLVSQHLIWSGSIYLYILGTNMFGPISFPTILFFMGWFLLSLCNHESFRVFLFSYAAPSYAPILCLPKFQLSRPFQKFLILQGLL